MRSTLPALRAKGHGWYSKFLKGGNEAFKRYQAPTPFDWSSNSATARPRAFFELYSGDEAFGRLEFELAEDILPKTVENFRILVTGIGTRKYEGTKIHQIRKESSIIGGDVVDGKGTGSHSAFESRFFPDENFIIPHTHRGLLR